MNLPTPPMVHPSFASTAAFVAVCTFVAGAFVLAVHFAWRGSVSAKANVLKGLAGACVWLTLTYALAESGLLSRLMGSPKFGLVLLGFNALTLALALGPVGKRFARELPIAALVGFHAFRLPLELVLHAWYEQGTLPVQMTYTGHNFDIITGVLALVLLPILPRFSAALRWRIVGLFSAVGLGLLITVVSIAVRSTPWPLRTYLEGPPVLLLFEAPYIWILPVCVCGALFTHVVTFRWLWFQRGSN